MLSRQPVALVAAVLLLGPPGCGPSNDGVTTEGSTATGESGADPTAGMSTTCAGTEPECPGAAPSCPEPASVCLGADPDPGTMNAPPRDACEGTPAEVLDALSVELCDPEICGETGLDKDIIRRIVQAHMGEVRHCYSLSFCVDPELQGRVVAQFTIDASGKVPWAAVQSTTLADASVGSCIARVIRRWKFPKPRGGDSVSVGAPFLLTPG